MQKKNKFNKILILEGDVHLHKNIFERFVDCVRDIDKNYKILYLGAGRFCKIEKYYENYYYPNETTGTFAISFDVSIFDELLQIWDNAKEPTDIKLWEISDKYKELCFVLFPNIVICDLSKSNIQKINDRTFLYEKFEWNLENYENIEIKKK